MAELLAPAGDLEKLKWADAYGADAVYFGYKNFSLRNFAGNFDLSEAEEGIKYLHKNNKKAYLTLNIYPYSKEFDELLKIAKIFENLSIDALIVSDLGVLFELKKAKIKTPIHISTQANTLNFQTINAYKELGVKRVNLARELSFEQIKEIQKNLKGIETEVFIHGAVCFSYSGRCAISDYMTGRSANRGECTHPCRWKYSLVEEKRPGEYHDVFEDSRGLYFFNSSDLALFNYMDRLKDIGVNSFKIEGRMKTIHYLASVISLYRKILDGENISKERALELLARVSTRGYSEGFMKGSIERDDYKTDDSRAFSNSEFVANTLYYDKEKEETVLRARNRIFAGEELELLSPGLELSTIKISSPIVKLEKKDRIEFDVIHNESLFVLSKELRTFSILRRINKY